jgi:acyl-CoA synthetase (AMP-forming)/AMP-acid ligase II
MLPNCVETLVCLFAAWQLGAVVTPVNPALTPGEVGFQLRDSGSTVLVGESGAQELAHQAQARFLPRSEVLTAPAPGLTPPLVEPDVDRLALVIYTSGTTGRPKGVLLDHRNLLAVNRLVIDWFSLGPRDRNFLILPLFHVNALVATSLSTLHAGGDVVIAPRFDPATFWDWVERYRPTFFSGVPTIYALLEARAGDRQVDTSSLRFVICGAAPMPADLIGRVESRFGVRLVEGYGLSEGTVVSTLNPLDGPRKAGTVGVALPGQQVRIVSPDGTPLPAGQAGEVVISGPVLMRGYLGLPDATAAVLQDGWLHTGDVGYLDDDGYLVLVDSLKDMIIRGGENIYPKEIEAVLYQHPAVLEAAVVGMPDPVMGEVPVAFVAVRDDVHVAADDLQAHCRERLARFKVPTRITLLDQLPKNSVGKIVKAPLREAAVAARPDGTASPSGGG